MLIKIGDPMSLNSNRSESNRPLKILVAEDNKVNQIVVRKILERENFEVDTVETGKEAVEAVQKKDYSFVFMDLHMPEMDGYEATRTIRELEKKTNKHVPIIALTASIMEEDRKNCLNVGMDEYISKPIGKEKIIQILEKTEQIVSNYSAS